ncbi:MAG: glycosyltransferase [Calditrichaeota bacterium]|nr:MAG: glycosyltransferase [Calditrichota bacterium]
MKIIFTSIQHVEGEFNGVACHIKDLKEELISKGHSVKLINPYLEPTEYSKLFTLARRFFYLLRKKTGISFFYLLVLLCIKLDVYQRVRRFIDESGKCDLINAHDVLTAGAALWASDGRVPVTLTCHFWKSPWDEFLGENFINSNFLSYKLLKMLIRNTFKSHKLKFTCVSIRNIRLLSKITSVSVAKARSKVIYLGVRPNERLPLNTALKYGLKIGKYVVNVGKLEERKNQRYFVNLVEECRKLNPEIKFVFVGPEEKKEKEFMLSKIAEKGLEENFVFLGEQSRDNVYSLMRDSLIYFHSSTNESFGMVLIEAMSVRTPVCSLRYEAIDELLPETPEMVFETNDSLQKISEIIKKVKEDEIFRGNIVEKQKETFDNHFTLSAMTKMYETYYKHLRFIN